MHAREAKAHARIDFYFTCFIIYIYTFFMIIVWGLFWFYSHFWATNWLVPGGSEWASVPKAFLYAQFINKQQYICLALQSSITLCHFKHDSSTVSSQRYDKKWAEKRHSKNKTLVVVQVLQAEKLCWQHR